MDHSSTSSFHLSQAVVVVWMLWTNYKASSYGDDICSDRISCVEQNFGDAAPEYRMWEINAASYPKHFTTHRCGCGYVD
jgi:hypothetical protein